MKAIVRHWRLIILVIGGWTLFSLFFTFQAYITSEYLGQTVPLRVILTLWFICGYAWALLTPLVIFLAKNFSLRRGLLARNLPVHLTAGALISLFHLSVFVLLNQMLLGSPEKTFSFQHEFQRLFVTQFYFDFLIYWALVGICHLREINRRFRERERETARLALETSQLETRLTQARLDALKMQLQPHFLFNTLNSISVLMRAGEVETANQMLVHLSELLRSALKSEGAQEISLREELEFLRGYLEIEQIRFQDRLTIDFQVENETLDAQVPNLILQPLVENAIRHGIAPRAAAGVIEIRTRRENGFIELRVSDNGAGFSQPEKQANGIGLKNTRERLEKLYGARQKFEILSPETGGWQVKIKIPYHENEK